MDLNYLLHRQGVERLRADRADCLEARAAHAELADLFGDLVEALRRRRLAAAGLGPDLRPPRL